MFLNGLAMTESKDYRQFLESEFSHIRTELQYIREGVNKTNGRVTELENQKVKYLETRVDIKMLKEIEAEVERVEKKLDESISWGHNIVDTRATHCPNVQRIDNLEKALDTIIFFAKHPKLLLFTVIGLFIVGIGIIVTQIL